ncbi:MAG: alpha/beta fold hydrolase [Rhizobiaceae bacterium]
MKSFETGGFRIAFVEEGEGEAVLLIHGFASTHAINWVNPGWIKALVEAGYRTVALDNLGHGSSSKSYDSSDYRPERMAAHAAALLDHLGIGRAHVFGYSMGARIAAFMALAYPDRVATLVLGGLGSGMTAGLQGGDAIQAALLADDPATIADPWVKMFRTFADQTKGDRRALAACMATSRQTLSEADVGRIVQPTLVAVGTKDDIGGPAGPLAALMPNAAAFDIEGRDHMLAVGDRGFKQRVLEFLATHPL